MNFVKRPLKWKIFLMVFFSFFSCTSSSTLNQIKITLKVIDLEGHSLSGFHIYHGDKKIGRTNSFGEWSYIFSSENNDSFFLKLVADKKRNDFSKRVKINFEKSEKGTYSFEKVVRIPRSTLAFFGKFSLESSHSIATDIQKFFSSIHFNFEDEKLKGEPNKIDLNTLHKALKNEALSVGLYYQFSSQWQGFIGPSEKGNEWIKIVSRIPLETESFSFSVKKEGSSKNIAKKIFYHLRKKAHYPYKIEKIRNEWFVKIGRVSQKSFWRIDKSIKLKAEDSFVSIKGNRKKDTYGFYLYPISQKVPFLCSSPEEKSCYLYSGSY